MFDWSDVVWRVVAALVIGFIFGAIVAGSNCA